jgi:hypothetical protein
MRPITPSSRPVTDNRMSYRAGGYRALWWVLVTGLCIIGLYWGVIRLTQTVSEISENITGQDSKISENIQNYYPGVLGLYRISRSEPGRD